MSNNLNECDDTFWNGSILGYWLKYTHTRKELLLICRVVSRFTSVRVGILQHREKSHNFYEITVPLSAAGVLRMDVVQRCCGELTESRF